MRYGRTKEKRRRLAAEGFLPIYSVDSEQEAEELLTAACSTNLDGEFVADMLAQEQSLENLYAFGDRLAEVEEIIRQRKTL